MWKGRLPLFEQHLEVLPLGVSNVFTVLAAFPTGTKDREEFFKARLLPAIFC